MRGLGIFLLFSGALYAQVPRFIKAYGGSNVDVGRSVYPTSDGGYIIGGYTHSYGSGSADYVLVKTNSIGGVQWARVYGGINADTGISVIQESDGSYVFLGKTYSYGAGSADFLLVKTYSTGSLNWARIYGGVGADEGWKIIKTGDNMYMLVGSTGSWGPGISVSRNFLALKVDTNGVLSWGKAYGNSSAADSTNDEVAYSVKQTSDGGYIIVGFTYWGSSDWDFMVVKVNSTGVLQWARAYGGANADTAFDVVQTPDGGYLVLGQTSNYGAGGRDIFLIKVSSTGAFQWAKAYGTSYNETSRSIYPTSDGNYVISGWTGYGGNYNALILKINPSGNLVWARSYGGSGGDWARHIHETPDGGFIISGLTDSYGGGMDDIMLIRTKPDGTIGGACPAGNPPITVTNVPSTPVTVLSLSTTNVSTGATQSINSWTINLSSFTITDICPLSSDDELSVHEKPNSKINVSWGRGYIKVESVEEFEALVYDERGVLVKDIRGSHTVKVDLKPGVYFLIVQSRGNREQTKIIVR